MNTDAQKPKERWVVLVGGAGASLIDCEHDEALARRSAKHHGGVAATLDTLTRAASLVDEMTKAIRAIDEDERFHYPTARVNVNAPLALIQVGMESRVRQAQTFLAHVGWIGPEMLVQPGPRKGAA